LKKNIKIFKLFSKNPLKNVKKYNIMVAIIGFVKESLFGDERTSNVTAHLLRSTADKNTYTTQGGFLL
jgi:hypothetical protein